MTRGKPRFYPDGTPTLCKGECGETYPASPIYFPEYEPNKIRGFCHACWAKKKSGWYSEQKTKPENMHKKDAPKREYTPREKALKPDRGSKDIDGLFADLQAVLPVQSPEYAKAVRYYDMAKSADTDRAIGRGALKAMWNERGRR